jgi:mannose-1-phosphate guanylyltransferase
MSDVIHPLLLCGGSGTRLWPLSCKSYPEQFNQLIGDESLFQASARRLLGVNSAPPIVVTASDFRFIVAEHLAGIETAAAATLIERKGRNTAPRFSPARWSWRPRIRARSCWLPRRTTSFQTPRPSERRCRPPRPRRAQAGW